MAEEPIADVNEITTVANALSQGIQAYCAVRGEMGHTISMGTLISALLSLTAIYMDDAPEEWRDSMVAQFIKRCSPKAMN